jgi:putative membrane protein
MTPPDGPYGDVDSDALILRDYLAAHRTVLANERTVLAYIRTVLTFLIGGVTFIQFFDSQLVRAMGWFFLPLALLIAAVGFVKYARMRGSLTGLACEPPEQDPSSRR